MPETRERRALEVLRRFSRLVDERHLVVMGPQDLTDPLWDDIEAVLRATPASLAGVEREPTDAEVADACLSYRHDYGLMDTMGQVWLQGEARGWLRAWRKVDPALLSGSGSPPGEGEVTYPCRQCGTPRTAAEGGTTFTVCDECWDRQYGRLAARRGEGGGE